MRSTMCLLAFVFLPFAASSAMSTRLAVPLHFEANRGQTDASVSFLLRAGPTTLFVAAGEAVLDTRYRDRRDVLRLRLVGADRGKGLIGEAALASRTHYLLGSDATGFVRDVPHYARVRQRDAWPGVDVVYRLHRDRLEYDFEVAPGAHADAIAVRFEGTQTLRIDEAGRLVARVGGTDVAQPAPFAFQPGADGGRRAVEIRWSLPSPQEAHFELGPYDKSAPLVIDPVIEWSTFLGGSGADTLYGVAVDAAGASYVTGNSNSLDLPSTPGAFQTAATGAPLDAFVAKIAPDGATLVYLTYFGGNSNDVSNGIAVDAIGQAVIAGSTASNNLPVLNAFQPARSTAPDAFVTKFDPSGGGLVYSTYLGGPSVEAAWGVATDPAGNAVAVGETQGNGFPVLNAVQPTWHGSIDGFVTKFDPNGALVYSTYLGGTDREIARGVASDSAGQAYVTGECFSNNFPTANPIQPVFGGAVDAFVTKLNSSGGVVYSTYLGGAFTDIGFAIGTDPNAQTYVTGYTYSANFPTRNPIQPAILGLSDAFVTKLNPSGSAFIYSTYLGGSGQENTQGYGLFRKGGITGDRAGSAYVTGATSSNDFPTANAVQPARGGNADAFAVKLDPPGQTLVWSTYLGGALDEVGRAIAIDLGASAYVVGDTDSPSYPTTLGSIQPVKAGAADGFATKIALPPDTFTCETAMSQPIYTAGEQVTATTISYANASITPEPVRFQLSVTVPGGTFPVFDIGDGGWFFMPEEFNVNLGPVNMFVVDGTTQLGAYSLDCAMLNPATGEVYSSSQASFTIQ